MLPSILLRIIQLMLLPELQKHIVREALDLQAEEVVVMAVVAVTATAAAATDFNLFWLIQVQLIRCKSNMSLS